MSTLVVMSSLSKFKVIVCAVENSELIEQWLVANEGYSSGAGSKSVALDKVAK